MPVGGYYIDKHEIDEFAAKLNAVAGSTKDLTRVYSKIGKHAENYVRGQEPIYAGPTKGRRETIHLQDHTKGGGGQRGAYVRISGVPYLYVQEFGGTSYWYRGGAGVLRKVNRGHRALGTGIGVQGGHPIYRKPRRALGYFIWNVAWRLRTFIGGSLTAGIQQISESHGIQMDITDRNLDIPQKPFSRT
jgi:hypothetical protein